MRLSFVHHIRKKANHLAFDSILYNWSLRGGGASASLKTLPVDSWPGDAERGRWLCGGAFSIDGEHLEMHGQCWEPVGVDESWLVQMHGFEWLRDLRALGGDQARQQARAMITSWMDTYSRWHSLSWRPDLTGQRVAHWLVFYDFFATSADEGFQDRLLDSLLKQARHLSRSLPGTTEGLPLLHGIKGLAYAGLAFEGRESWLGQALDLLQEETEKQILSDGGHVSRSPAQLQAALQIFIDLRHAILSAGYPVPEKIEHTIDRMAQALRFFRYADKGFALFNGAQEGDRELTDAVLAKSNARGKVLRGLPYTGYERAVLGRSLLMVDTGTPPHHPYDRQAHAAPLGFEFAYGKERVFVSCGSHPADKEWQDVLRGTAAHNALALDYRNICEVRDDGHLGRKPRKVTVMREESKDALLLECSHDGYVPLNGVTHRRRFFLLNQGHDFRGEENLTCSIGLSRPLDIILRFHLHPRVLVSLIQDGDEALLRLPGGAGWRFFCTGGRMALENSIYLGEGCQIRKTKQLVIYSRMESDHVQVKWALQRESR